MSKTRTLKFRHLLTADAVFGLDDLVDLQIGPEHVQGQLDRRALRAILDSPTLLAILDETNLVADLSPIADDIERAIDQALEHIATAKDAVPRHIEALKHRDQRMRMRAANSLGILGPTPQARSPRSSRH